MCHSCVSRNPGFFPHKRESSLLPVQVGIPAIGAFLFLDSRFRGNDTGAPSPGLFHQACSLGLFTRPHTQPAVQAGLSTAGGEANRRS